MERPFDERLKDLRKGLADLCKTYDIEITAGLRSTPQAIVAQIVFLDLANEEVLSKWGLKRTGQEQPSLSNPLRN